MFCLTLLLVLLNVVLFLVKSQTRKRRADEPPLISGWIPYVGKALELRKDPRAFLEHLQKEHGSVFTVKASGNYFTYVMDPLLYPAVTKHDRHFTLDDFINDMFESAFNLPRWETLPPEITKQIYSSLSLFQGQQLTPLTDNSMENLAVVFRQEYMKQGPPHWRTENLYDFCVNVIQETTLMTLYGRPSVADRHSGMDAMKKDFLDFDKMFGWIWAGVPFCLMRRTKEVRERLVHRFLPEVISEWTNASVFAERRIQLGEKCEGIQGYNNAALHFLSFWAAVVNTAPTAFWCLYYLLKHQEALQAVKAEIQEVMSQEGEEFSPDRDVTISREQLDRLKYLKSALQETQRLCAVSSVVRSTRTDLSVQLDTHRSVTVRRGDRVVLYPRSLHMDPEVYPQPQKFQFDRFLDKGEEKKDFYKAGQRLVYYLMPFGFGHRMCPGRYLGLNEVKILVCLMLMYFDLELLDHSVTEEHRMDVMYPASQVRFRYRCRAKAEKNQD